MSKNRKVILAGMGVLVLGFLAIQLIPVSARNNPPVVTQIQWDSPHTAALMHSACYDCHSNETNWPWYAYVAPVSWLVARDVSKGRRNLNLSEVTADQVSPEEMIEQVQRGKMPPSMYVMLHPEARLTDEQKTQLIAGLSASLTGREHGERGEAGEDDD